MKKGVTGLSSHPFSGLFFQCSGEFPLPCVFLGVSERVNHSTECVVDFFETAKAFHFVSQSFFLIPFDERSRLVVIDVQSFLDGLRVVVGTSGCFSSIDESFHQHFFGHVEFKHSADSGLSFRKHFLQCFRLWDGAWEPIEDDSFAGAECVVGGSEDVNHQFVGDELSFVDETFGGVAEFAALFDFSAEHVSGGDVFESVFFDEEVTLCAFS